MEKVSRVEQEIVRIQELPEFYGLKLYVIKTHDKKYRKRTTVYRFAKKNPSPEYFIECFWIPKGSDIEIIKDRDRNLFIARLITTNKKGEDRPYNDVFECKLSDMEIG